MRPYREITRHDIGSQHFRLVTCKHCGNIKTFPVSGFIGQILPGDVGKRVYLVGNILQVENDEQRDKRIAA